MSNRQEWEEWYYKNVILPKQFPDVPIWNDLTISIGTVEYSSGVKTNWLRTPECDLFVLNLSNKIQGENQWVSFRS